MKKINHELSWSRLHGYVAHQHQLTLPNEWAKQTALNAGLQQKGVGKSSNIINFQHLLSLESIIIFLP